MSAGKPRLAPEQLLCLKHTWFSAVFRLVRRLASPAAECTCSLQSSRAADKATAPTCTVHPLPPKTPGSEHYTLFTHNPAYSQQPERTPNAIRQNSPSSPKHRKQFSSPISQLRRDQWQRSLVVTRSHKLQGTQECCLWLEPGICGIKCLRLKPHP